MQYIILSSTPTTGKKNIRTNRTKQRTPEDPQNTYLTDRTATFASYALHRFIDFLQLANL